MMKKRLALLSMILFIGISMSFNSCKKDSDDESDEFSYEKVTVDHFLGFDFSENLAQDSDGAVIGWQPGGAIHSSYNNGDYLWWITRSITGDATNKTKDMGTVALSSITEAPTSWDISPNITPLLVGHVYVAKCIDGYVKFEVLSVSPSEENWPVEIKYSFSSTSTFDN